MMAEIPTNEPTAQLAALFGPTLHKQVQPHYLFDDQRSTYVFSRCKRSIRRRKRRLSRLTVLDERMGCFRCLGEGVGSREGCEGKQRRTFQILDRSNPLQAPAKPISVARQGIVG